MAIKYLNNIDMNLNEILNLKIQQLATDPSGANLVQGLIWMNTSTNPPVIKYYDGTSIITLGQIDFETSASNIKANGTASVGSLSTVARADHVHPSDTTKQDVINANNKLSASYVSGLATVATSGSYEDLSDKPVIPEGSEGATEVPLMDSGSGAVGSGVKWAREDHVHPSDTSKADKTSTVSNVAYDSTNKKITETINGTTSDVVTVSTLKSALGAGQANGLAELDANGVVPSAQLPSYVDDVLEYSSSSDFPATGETGKIYIALDTNKTYRWGGSTYVEISASLSLGETSSTAYRGDRGAAAYTHAVTNKGSAFASGLYKITTNSEGHVTAATAVTKSDITDLGITDIGKYTATNPALTASGGVCTWTVSHGLGTSEPTVEIYETTNNERVVADIAIASTSAVTIKILSTSNITSGAYKVVVLG